MLILIRHAQSDANASALLVGRLDAALSEHGRSQALTLAGVISRAAQIRSSPLSRALDTARLAGATSIEIDDAFIEQDYGTLEGHAMSEVPAEEWRRFRSDHTAAIGGGESLADVDRRVHARLDELARDEAALLTSADEHLVVISHVSPIKSAVAWALGVPGPTAWRMRLDNASLTTIGVRDRGPYLVGYNETAHWRDPGTLQR